MSIASKAELSVLSHEEQEMVRLTHHPAIYQLDGEALRTLQRRLREQRGKMRTFVRQKRREARGKAEARGASFPGDAEQPRRRKQVFAAALKRVAKELARLRALEARTEHVEAARQALALARTEKFVHHPAAGDTPRTGPRPASHRSQKQARARQHHRQHRESEQGRPGQARRQARAAGVKRQALCGRRPSLARISATARSQPATRSGPAGWLSSMPVSLRPEARAMVTRKPRALSRSMPER